ncbi:MAG TPA: hypothetical protein PKJ95_04325 [Atribacterota bacterium]|nr:hypothetical protein [Atribacterota bacterium]
MEPVKLISDEQRHAMKLNKGELLTLMEEYKVLEMKEQAIIERKKWIKSKLCGLVKNQGEKKTDKQTSYKSEITRLEALVTTKRNIKFTDKNGLMNYCRQAGFRDLIVTEEDIDKKRFTAKWDNGALPQDISMFIEISYDDSLQVKEW